MIMGDICTRRCPFCDVAHGRPLPLDKNEPKNLAESIYKLNLNYVVVTSVDRDDLKDGGAGHFVECIDSIRYKIPNIEIEILIPDFRGREQIAINSFAKSLPDVLNHNVETVPSLYRTVRKGSLYKRSLDLLSNCKDFNPKQLTKSGLMVGLGEDYNELEKTFNDIFQSNVDILTLGQYLKPDSKSLDVERFYKPEEFKELKSIADTIGFKYVFSGPMVRSSYLADHVFEDLESGNVELSNSFN